MPLLPVQIDEIGEVFLLALVNDIGSGLFLCAVYAHVERPVETEGESALGLVKLH